MRSISDSTRSISEGETSREDGDIADAFTGNNFHQSDSIRIANSIPIERIFKHYGVNLNKYSRKAVCPFKSHKGGRENSPSFNLYPDTNSYCCFGCHQGSKGVDFVSIMDNTTKSKAAAKILSLFGDDVGDDADVFIDHIDFSEQLEIMMIFSNEIREFRKNYIDNESCNFIDNICETYDDICLKHELDNEALRMLVEKYQRKINIYKSCLSQ
jgi:hypothetical protein